jgi:ribonuclease H / adenosylcobalamin/alpha-ribazole phosphatase
MKWPASITLVRHAQSAYNELRQKKEADAEYGEFRRCFERDPDCEESRALAERVAPKFALGVSDFHTPLTAEGQAQAEKTGRGLDGLAPRPDVIYYSPYLRTRETLRLIRTGWAGLEGVRTVEDDRIREQEHGLSLLYSDWRMFHVFHPEQRRLYALLGAYWYQYPQGESVSQVRDRCRSFTTMLLREHAGEHVLVVTHHLTILSFRANYERLTPDEFLRIDEEEKPFNCGVTLYRGDAQAGRNGRLVLDRYNVKLY